VTFAFVYNPHYPGQYYDSETWKFYNYARDYDPQVGRYVESDPIGLHGGINTYGYALQNPVTWMDPTGRDVTLCYYPTTVGHIGVGVAPNQTVGLYPASRSLSVAICGTVDGVIQRDDPVHDWATNSKKQCLTIKTTPDQDAAVLRYIDLARQAHRHYNLCNNQCTSFARDALDAGGIPLPGGATDAIEPQTLFNLMQRAYSPARARSW
jgi:RHS repeat-associated protein